MPNVFHFICERSALKNDFWQVGGLPSVLKPYILMLAGAPYKVGEVLFQK